MSSTFALVGHPLGHSFSAHYFSEKFEREGIDAGYLNFDMESVEGLREIIRNDESICGLNVTIPHKQAVIPLLDDLSAEAREIGAVNVIQVLRSEAGLRLVGHNTDIIGFTSSLRPLLRPHHRKALVLGTGGASLAITKGLQKLGIEVQRVSRTARPGILAYKDITPELLNDFLVIVNCSPVGMHPHTDEVPLLPYAALTPRHLLYDLVYNPLLTRFMQLGMERGATAKNGLEMLHLQAEAAWEIWN